MRIFSKLAAWFFRGIAISFPIALTFYVVYAGFTWLDSLVPMHTPGLGIAAIVAGVTAVGFLGSTYLARGFFGLFDKGLQRLPLVKIIYTSLKDLTGAFVGENKRMNRPVLVQVFADQPSYRIGFLTQDDCSHLGQPGMVAVYLPDSYNFSGELWLVPASQVQPLAMPAAEAMKLVVSGGVTQTAAEPLVKA